MYSVLFVEDELLVRLGLQKAVSWEKFNMKLEAQADNGIKALELFRSVRPDVVITDICMPGMDGYELIQKIRAEDDECAIIVLSCLEDFEMLRKMIPYKIIGYITKADMKLEDIAAVLEKTKSYLDKTGRSRRKEPEEEIHIEERIFRYFSGEDKKLEWEGKEKVREILLFEIMEEEKEKVNDLSMRFLYELAHREIPQGIVAKTGEKGFCVLMQEENSLTKEQKEKIYRLAKGFLDISLQINRGARKEGEELKEMYLRVKRLSDENCGGNVLITDAVRYIQAHYRDNSGLGEISAFLGISPGYFSALFKKEMGKTYVEYLNEVRLKEAAKELMGSDDKLTVIAENCGFNNVEYFCRMFKKYMGMSPAKWREENK